MLDVERLLVVAAHPDDEALGCGGTIARAAAGGTIVDVLFLSDGVNAREGADCGELQARQGMALKAAALMGARPPAFLEFPDNRLDSVDLLDVISAIEHHASELAPVTVLTHFPGDLNVDHRLCAQAVLTAFRPVPEQSVRHVLGFEVPSSTEWAFGVAGQDFVPNLLVDVGDYLSHKLAALAAYSDEMRQFPHARSIESVEALTRWRGASAGVHGAEAFRVLRSIL